MQAMKLTVIYNNERRFSRANVALKETGTLPPKVSVNDS